MLMTVSDLFKSAEPPKLATRRAVAEKLAGLEGVLHSLVTIYGDTLEAVTQCREMLAADDDDPVDLNVDDDAIEGDFGVGDALPEPTVQTTLADSASEEPAP
jgi:D-serine deaminase-like pyridoxal phosphate-dependent protein